MDSNNAATAAAKTATSSSSAATATTSMNPQQQQQQQDVQEQALKSTTLELKKQALVAKKDGNITVALQLLQQSKDIEKISMSSNEQHNSLPSLYWKRLAILYKQAGRMEEAKIALLRSKEIDESQDLEKKDTESETITTDNEQVVENKNNEVSICDTGNDNVETEEDQTLLAELNEKNSKNDDIQNIDETMSSSMTFTVTEMMDEEMMTEFKTAGMTIPSKEVYSNEIVNYKKKALQYKQHNEIQKATQSLRVAKQLEKVLQALQSIDVVELTTNEDPSSWMQTLTAEESELLGELLTSDQNNNFDDDEQAILLTRASETLTVEELDTMNDQDIFDFVEMMGIASLPTVEKLQDDAIQYQKQAIEYKQAGNIDNAKTSLLNAKRSKAQAERLAKILVRLQESTESATASGTQEVSIDDLEALVNKRSERKETKAKKEQTSPSPKDSWHSKPSAEIKSEIIRLKNEKQVKEATRLLDILKQVLSQEQQRIEKENDEKLIKDIDERVRVCNIQERLWHFYSWYIDPSFGTEQYNAWEKFKEDCKDAIKQIQAKGTNSIKVSNQTQDSSSKLYAWPNDDIDEILGCCQHSSADSNSHNDDFEIAVLKIFSLNENERLRKLLSKKQKEAILESHLYVRIDAKVPLLHSSNDSSQPLHIEFAASNSTKVDENSHFEFDESSRKRFALPRDESRHAKSLKRRIETKAVQFTVYLTCLDHRQQDSSKVSWFFNQRRHSEVANDEGNDKDVMLGKVSIELRQLFERNWIAGDYPLMINNKNVGGVLRMCLRIHPSILGKKTNENARRPSPEAQLYNDGLKFDIENRV